MSDGAIRVEQAGGVVRLVIDRPDKRNALTWEMVGALREAVASARHDDSARVLVLTGAGDRAFCSGADLSTMGEGSSFVERHEARGELAGLFQDLWSCGMPTVASVRGFALAGGFGLALACDLVVAADDAVFGTPEVNVGLWPYMITVPMLRSMGPKQALDLMLTGRRVDAEEALRLGFVSRVVPVADLDGTVGELADGMAARSPIGMRLGRDAFYEVLDSSAEQALAHLHAMLTLHNQTDDAAEGLAAFAERREPRWTGR